VSTCIIAVFLYTVLVAAFRTHCGSLATVLCQMKTVPVLNVMYATIVCAVVCALAAAAATAMERYTL
jgi:hypothetical protein